MGKKKGSGSLFNQNRANRILRLIAEGNHKYVAAMAAGVSESTVQEWIRRGEGRDNRDPTPELEDFAKRYREAEANAEAHLVKSVTENEDWRAKAWVLKNRFPKRWSDAKKLEVTFRQELDEQLQKQFDAFFALVLGDPNIPTYAKERILQHAASLSGGEEPRAIESGFEPFTGTSDRDGGGEVFIGTEDGAESRDDSEYLVS